MNGGRFEDFLRFSRAQLATQDIDPAYPVLRERFAEDGVPREIALWRLLLFVACYHLGSAEALWTRFPTPGRLPPGVRVATGTERRGFRGNDRLAAFVNGFLQRGAPRRWIEDATEWAIARAALQTVPGGGPWASYKWADLLKNVLGLPLLADSVGENPSPLRAMSTLTGFPAAECASNLARQRGLLQAVVGRGVALGGLDQLETCLCDFNSLTKGHYYTGHDIDSMMGQLGPGSPLWATRARVFRADLLGERGGWTGVRRERLRSYVEQGILWR